MHKLLRRININHNSIFQKELINNKLSLKKGYTLGKFKKKSYLIDNFDDYMYIYNDKKNFKDLYSIPIEIKNLKSKNFAKLKVSSNLVKYHNTLKQIPRIDKILKNEGFNFILNSNSSSLDIKYKNLISKISNSSSIDSFLTTNNKKDIFLTPQNYFFVKRGSFNPLQHDCFLDLNFKTIKNNFTISKKRKITTFGLNSHFSFKRLKNEKNRKDFETNNN